MNAALSPISPNQTSQRPLEGPAFPVDVRAPDEFACSHVAGAASFPISGWDRFRRESRPGRSDRLLRHGAAPPVRAMESPRAQRLTR